MIIEVFENEFVKCELDDSLPVLKHRWLSVPSGEEFKNILTTIRDKFVELKESYPRLAWLADTKLLGELDEETEQWLVDSWETMLFREAGVKIHGVILGSSIYSDYPMEKFKLDAEEKFKTEHIFLGVFNNEKDAYAWVRRKQSLI